MVLGNDEEVYYIFVKSSRWISILFLFLAIYFQLDLMIKYGIANRPKGCPIYTYLVEGIAMWCISVFNIKSRKDRMLGVIGLILIGISCILTLGRGYITVSIVLCYFYYRFSDAKKNINKSANLKFIAAIITMIIIVNLVAPSIVESFLGRLTVDTRSGQYEVFFEQVSLSQLIMGQGIGATYSFSRFSNYSYIDNCNLVMAFRYGLPLVVLEYILFFKGLIASYKHRSYRDWQLIIIWILMTNGFSTYLPYKLNITSILVWVVLGHILSTRTCVKVYQ